MTEKSYGGSTGRGTGEMSVKAKPIVNVPKSQKEKKVEKETYEVEVDDEKILKAGKIAAEVREWIRPQIKKDMLLLEIAEKIESKIEELGGKPAFPVSLSINEVAAHVTPSPTDETKAHGLLKVDFGAHIDGWCSDNAFSIDLENSEENKKLIEAAEEALDKAIETIKEGITTGEIGKTIQNTIESKGFQPIANLSGHEIGEYDLHAGLTIPNIDDGRKDIIQQGLYAIEPFSTNGLGKVKDGKPSGIYMLTDPKNVRSPLAREVLGYIAEEYVNMPFCTRWLTKKFGNRALLALRELERNGNLHHFNQLIEIDNGIVAQAEHTVFISDKVEITTK